jgi:hypothetical protein
MRGLTGEELLQRPVRVRGIELGRLVDLILDPAGRRVIGFDVLCGDGEHRFLPLAAAESHFDEIAVRSSLTLPDGAELSFYRERGTTLTVLRSRDPADVVLGDGGVVAGRIHNGDAPSS